MSFELPNPEQRTSIDVNSPITIVEGIDYRAETQRLADEIVATTSAMTMRVGEPLPGDYIVEIGSNTIRPLCSIATPEQIQKLLLSDGNYSYEDEDEDEDDDEDEMPAPIRLQLKLTPIEGILAERGNITFDNDDETMRISIYGPKQTITVRDAEFVVRHFQHLRMWNYYAAKKKQGHPEEHYPGNRWDPDYTESVIIDEGEYAGQDLVTLLREFDEAVEELQADPLEALAKKTLGADWDQLKRLSLKVKCEVADATGYKMHTSMGVNALQEMRDLLTSIRQLVA